MAIRNAVQFRFTGHGLSDAQDTTDGLSGAMRVLQNLIPAPSTPGVFVCRPAASQLTNFPTYNTPTNVTALTVSSDRVFGFLTSSDYPGYDVPFVYDLIAQAFIPIIGLSTANLPVTQPTTGDWTPPRIAAITASKTIFTHPGFSGTGDNFFGVLDTSSYTFTLKGNTVSGSTTIASINDGGTSAPILDGVQNGMQVSGAGIPAGTYVVGCSNGTFSLSTTANTHSGSALLDGIPSTTSLAPGMTITAPGVPAGTYIVSISGPSSLVMSANATATANNVATNFSGGGSITLSNGATATANNVTLTITGGTNAAPLWAAVNTNGAKLVAVPAAVAQFGGRAWYATFNDLVYSDPLNATQVTNASQVLVLDGPQPITALSGSPLQSPISGGVVQALIAFKGASGIYQITGDAATNNLAQNFIAGSVGTLAPNTITPTPLGLAYIAPDGMRIFGLNGECTDPIGAFGRGVSVPFLNAINPSRMSMAYNQGTLRVSVQNAAAPGQPWQEFWFETSLKSWSGPHTCANTMIQPYTPRDGSYGFISVLQAAPSSLFSSTCIPTASANYLENNAILRWQYTPCLLPDNGNGSMNSIVQSSIMLSLGYTQTIGIVAQREDGTALDVLSISGKAPTSFLYGYSTFGASNFNAATPSTAWGGLVWGNGTWGVLTTALQAYPMPWHQPLVFKQLSFTLSGDCTGSVAIGAMNLTVQPLKYMLQEFTL